MNTYQQVNKGFQQKCFFAAHGLCPANQAKPGLQTIAPKSRIPDATAKFAMPFLRTRAAIVLPDFIRSCSADEEKKTTKQDKKALVSS
ncbi:MAG TPA: hypothetical protein VK668_12775 [Mucilaginibacter sp.]|nr:hypothetical protein [Mucilaginibacter sp.]